MQIRTQATAAKSHRRSKKGKARSLHIRCNDDLSAVRNVSSCFRSHFPDLSRQLIGTYTPEYSKSVKTESVAWLEMHEFFASPEPVSHLLHLPVTSARLN